MQSYAITLVHRSLNPSALKNAPGGTRSRDRKKHGITIILLNFNQELKHKNLIAFICSKGPLFSIKAVPCSAFSTDVCLKARAPARRAARRCPLIGQFSTDRLPKGPGPRHAGPLDAAP